MDQRHQVVIHQIGHTRHKDKPVAVPRQVLQAISRCHNNQRDHPALIRIHRSRTIIDQIRMRNLEDTRTLKSKANRIPIRHDQDFMVSELIVCLFIF